MFDIGFLELLVIALITLVVMGPERLPEVVRTLSLWIGRFKQQFASARRELEKEVGMDDIRHQLHNEQIMRDLGNTKTDLENSLHPHSSGESSDSKISTPAARDSKND